MKNASRFFKKNILIFQKILSGSLFLFFFYGITLCNVREMLCRNHAVRKSETEEMQK